MQQERKYTNLIQSYEIIDAIKKGMPTTSEKGLSIKLGSKLKKIFTEYYFEDNLYYLVIEDSQIMGSILIAKEAATQQIGLFFNNCSCYYLELRGIKTIPHVTIQNCYFEWIMIEPETQITYIHVYNTEIKQSLISRKSKIEFVHFTKSVIAFIDFKQNSEIGSVSIMESTNCGNLHFDSESKINQLFIKNNCVIGYILLTVEATTTHFIIENSKIQEIRMHKVTWPEIRIEKSQIEKLKLDQENNINKIIIKDNSFIELFEFGNSKCNEIEIEKSLISFEIGNAITSNFKIEGSYIPSLKWSTRNTAEIYISNSFLNNIDISKATISKDSLISFVDCCVNKINLIETPVLGIFRFVNLKALIKPFDWPGFIQIETTKEMSKDKWSAILLAYRFLFLADKSEKFKQANKKLTEENNNSPFFKMLNTSLGKSEFIGSDLSNFIFKYKNSVLLDCFISGTNLPTKISVSNVSSAKETEEQKIIFYSQIRKVLEKTGDIVGSSIFHSMAMEHQENLYKIVKPKIWSKDWFDKINFNLNKISNVHGENWGRSLLFIFASSFILYTLYYTSINYKASFSIAGIAHFIEYYIPFLNITHHDDFMISSSELSFLPRLIDFLSKIVIGFGIYQLIAAFRRHGKK